MGFGGSPGSWAKPSPSSANPPIAASSLAPAGCGQLPERPPSNSDLFLKLFPHFPPLAGQVKALGSPWGLTDPQTSAKGVGRGREDTVDLNRVTFPFKCLPGDPGPHSVTRTKEKARPPILLLWFLGKFEVGVSDQIIVTLRLQCDPASAKC